MDEIRRSTGEINDEKNNLNLKKNAANLSVISNLSLTIIKFIVGILTSSISIVSEAFHSGIDLFAALIARFSVVKAMQPPDEEHRFGHGKVENVGSLIEALIIFIVSIIIIYSSVRKIILGAEVNHLSWGILVMFVSSVTNLLVGRKVKSVSIKTDSAALEADAFHMMADVYCSLGVLAALIVIYIGKIFKIDLSIVDPLTAIFIALFISYMAYNLVKKAMNILIDTKLPEEHEKIIVSILESHYDEILNYHALRTRKSGFTKHIDLHIVVPRDESVGTAHGLCDNLEKEIRAKIPGTDIIIHVEPCDGKCQKCDHKQEICNNAGA